MVSIDMIFLAKEIMVMKFLTKEITLTSLTVVVHTLTVVMLVMLVDTATTLVMLDHTATTSQLRAQVKVELTETYLLTWVYSTLFVSSKEPVLNT
jgi:hypothetical protein